MNLEIKYTAPEKIIYYVKTESREYFWTRFKPIDFSNPRNIMFAIYHDIPIHRMKIICAFKIKNK